MREAGIDERHQQKHRRQHEQFIINLREMWNGRATQPDLHGRLMGFLVSWIGLHILGVDPSMVRQLRQVKAGRAAGDAHPSCPMRCGPPCWPTCRSWQAATPPN